MLVILLVLEHFAAKKLGSNGFIPCPGRYRKEEEKQRKSSVTFVGRNFATVKSYDPKTTQSNEHQINEC